MITCGKVVSLKEIDLSILKTVKTLPFGPIELLRREDAPGFGKNHYPMHNGHLNAALKAILIHLGLESNVTARTFGTTYAFNSILDGKVPDWQIAERMGHANGNPTLCRHVYVPSMLPVDPAREPGEPTEAAKKVLEQSGAHRHLPIKEQVDPALLEEAQDLINTYYDALAREVADPSRRVPRSLQDRIQESFAQINSGV